MRRAARLFAIATCCAAITGISLSQPAFSQPVQGNKRLITEKDIFQFNWIGDPQISPDGTRVAFVKVTVDEKKTGYETAIWSVSIRGDEQPRRITDGKHDSSPRWSPDGKWLVFLRTPEARAPESAGPAAGGSGGAGAPGHGQSPQLYLLPVSEGGESWKITDLPRGAGSPVWSPDGKMIAFTSDTSAEDLARQRKKDKDTNKDKDKKDKEDSKPEAGPATAKSADSSDAEHESDVRVITRSVYRINGVGYLDYKHPQHIWMIVAPQSSEDDVKPKQVTTGKYQEDGIMWSPDSSKIYYTTTRVDDPSYENPHADVYSVAAAGGAPTKILSINMAPREMSLSPDGKRLAFCASINEPVQSYTEPDLWVVDLAADAKPRNLTANYDFDVCSGVSGDQGTPRAGGPDHVVWSADGNSLIVTTAREGRANLIQVDIASARISEITHGSQAVERFRANKDASGLAVLISTPTNIGDLFWIDRALASSQPRRLTHINDKLFFQLNLTEPEEIWYTSFDGKKIHGWIQKPPDFDPSKKYPLILNIHGGPHAAYGFIFDHEFQWMAAKGYVVLYPNPRGSTSYGQQFGNIIQYRYPGDDFRDLMIGVDEVLKRGYIDPKKLGVTGGSGGGLLTDWIVGHTDRFAAAVAQRDIASWAAWWYAADFTLFQPSWFKAPPFQDPQDYVNRSPITYIQNVHTPLMLVLGEADFRTPPATGGEEMFRALKFLKRPVIMVRFPGESHELSRSGQPWHRVERLEHIVGWFDKYLQGMPKPEYDDVTTDEVSVKPADLPGKHNPNKPAEPVPPKK
ncbi:MAG TPA: S9 family peptidase [Candidatus Acidoferrales bacterium]|nr:S9 family peptidase [Candidatus Acidoferrales bacterium]